MPVCLALSLLLWCQGVAQSAEEVSFESAAEQYRAGHWQEAATGFAAYLSQRPDAEREVEARFYHGEALAQLGQWQDALPEFLDVLRQQPDGSHVRQSLFRAGEAAYMIADDETAARYLSDFRERYVDDPLNAFALPYLGNLQLQARDAYAAESLFAEALRRFPSGPLTAESEFGLAQAWHQEGQLEKARQAYQDVVKRGGELVEPALAQLASAENSLGNFDQALSTIDRFAEQYPQSPLADKVRLARGYSLFKLDRNDEAQQTLAPLAERPEMNIDASYLIGLSQAAEGQWQAAAKTLASIPVDQEHSLAPAIAFQTADALLNSGDTEAATKAFDHVLSTFADSPWADDSLLGKTRIAIDRQDAASSLELADELLARFPDSPLAAQAKLAKGQALATLERPEEAIAALQAVAAEATSNDPTVAELKTRAQSLLALSQAKLGQFEEAQQAVTQMAEDASNADLASDLKVRVGELAQAAGKTEMANDLLASVSGASTAISGRAQSGLAWSHFNAGRWADAAAAFEQAFQASPTGPQAAEALLLQGRALEHLDQNDQALALYEQVLQQFPESSRAAEAMLCAARLDEKLGRSQPALSHYSELIEKHPDFPSLDEAIYRSGWLLRSSDPAASQALFERLQKEYATSSFTPDAVLQLADQAVAERQFDRAAELLREITRPDAPPAIRPPALYLEGRMELVRGNWKAAEKPLGQLLNEHADSELALPAEYLLAEATFRQDDFQRSLEYLTSISSKTQDSTEPWLATAELRRAQCLAQLRKWDEAAEVAQAIPTRFPQFSEPYEADYIVGRALAARAQFDEARQWYQRVLADPAAAETETASMSRWMIGESYFHQEQYEQAVGQYLQVGEKFPHWHSAALLQAGKAQETLGRWQDAADIYQKLVTQYPDGKLSGEATRRLETARQRASNTPAAATTLQ